jgi:proton-coupled amino acid transporter
MTLQRRRRLTFGSSVSLPALLAINSDTGTGTGNFAGAFSSTFKSVFGTGVLAFPYAVKSAGLLYSLIGTVIICIWSFYTAHLISRCAHLCPSARSFDDVCEAAFGRAGQWIGGVNLVLHQILVAAAYLVFCAKTIAGLCGTACESAAGPDSYATWVVLALAPPLLVFCSLRDVSVLAPVSACGNVAVVVCLVVILVSVAPSVDFGRPDITWVPTDPAVSVATFFGMSVFTFAGQTEVVTVYLSMRDRARYPEVLVSVALLSLAIFGGFGAIVYAGFGEKTHKVIVENLDNGATSVIAKIAISVVVYLTLPLKMMPAFEVVEGAARKFAPCGDEVSGVSRDNNLVGGDAHHYRQLDDVVETPGSPTADLENGHSAAVEERAVQKGGNIFAPLRDLLLRWTLSIVPLAVALLVTDFGFLVAFVGAFCLSLIAFVLPPFMFIRLGGCEGGRLQWIAHVLLGVAGSLACIYCTAQCLLQKFG